MKTNKKDFFLFHLSSSLNPLKWVQGEKKRPFPPILCISRYLSILISSLLFSGLLLSPSVLISHDKWVEIILQVFHILLKIQPLPSLLPSVGLQHLLSWLYKRQPFLPDCFKIHKTGKAWALQCSVFYDWFSKNQNSKVIKW